MLQKNNSSIIVDRIRGKDGLKYNNVINSTHNDLHSIVLKKITVQLSLIELEEK